MRCGQSGFSLLEVLAAFSILALSLGVLMRIFSGALNNVEVARDQAEALIVAQSMLASATVEPLPSGGDEASGRHGERFEWQVSIRPYLSDQDSVPTGVGLTSLWEIVVRVAWPSSAGGRDRAVSLRTVRARGAVPP
jgi:general secretion pathway protein I